MSLENLNFWRPGEIIWKWILQASGMLVKTVRCFSASSPLPSLPQSVGALAFRLELSGTSHLLAEICSTVSWGNICAGDGERLSFREIASGTWLSGLPWWLHGKEFTCQCKRCRFDHWVRKITWRRKWQPTPVFLPGKSHGQRHLWATIHGVAKSQTRLKKLINNMALLIPIELQVEREQRGSGLESMV